MDQLLVRLAEREQRLPGKKKSPHSSCSVRRDCGTQLLAAPLGEMCRYPLLFFTVCLTYLPRRRMAAVLIAPGAQLDMNAN